MIIRKLQHLKPSSLQSLSLIHTFLHTKGKIRIACSVFMLLVLSAQA